MNKLSLKVIIMTLCFMLIFPSFAFANDEVTPYTDGYTFWRVQSASYSGNITGSKMNMGLIGTATRDGETLSGGVSTSANAEISAQAQVSKNDLSAALGFSISESVTVQTYKTTPPLKKGQNVYGTYAFNYSRYRVVQEQIRRIDGYEEVITTKTIYVDRPTGTAQVWFEYR